MEITALDTNLRKDFWMKKPQPIDIDREAKRFWRDYQFDNICCSDSECDFDLIFDFVNDEIATVYLHKHNYSVHFYSNSTIKFNSPNPISAVELKFWECVAKYLYDIPIWMLEETESDECICETSILMQSGCLCGGL